MSRFILHRGDTPGGGFMPNREIDISTGGGFRRYDTISGYHLGNSCACYRGVVQR